MFIIGLLIYPVLNFGCKKDKIQILIISFISDIVDKEK